MILQCFLNLILQYIKLTFDQLKTANLSEKK